MGRLKDAMIVEGAPSKRAEQLAIAIKKLGKNWILHPDYERTEAHRCRDSYYMRQVRDKAIEAGRL